jgi:transposase-like protein
MSDDSLAEKLVTKEDRWRERLAEQARSGLTVKQFCREQGLTEWSFYTWRKRLREDGPVRFALVERRTTAGSAMAASLELVLGNGERLRISAGVDRTTLRTVVEVLRA